MADFPTLQTIHHHFGARLQGYEYELAKLEELLAFLDRLVESHPLLSSGMCLAIDGILCSSTFLYAYAIKRAGRLVYVFAEFTAITSRCQGSAILLPFLGDGQWIRYSTTFDQIVTKAITHM
jgi:hypothetical protein